MNATRRIGLAAGLLMLGTLAGPQLSLAAPPVPASIDTAEAALVEQAGYRHRHHRRYHGHWHYRDHWRYRHYWKQCRHGYWGYRCKWRLPN